MILSLVSTALLASTRAAQSQTVPTEQATVEVAAEMEAAPTDCAPAPEPFPISEHYGPVLGTWPVWGTIVYTSGERTGVLAIANERPDTDTLPGWWPQKVLWLVKTNYEGEVQLHGYNVADDSPMYFSLNANAPITAVTLNPKIPGAFAAGSEQFANFPSYVWVSKAGCYLIEAQWDGGLWRQTIAVGLVE